MAMNKNLKEGSIILYYPQIEEVRGWGMSRRPAPLRGYNIYIHALYVYSRRARTNGTWLPGSFKPVLDSLNIRTNTNPHYRTNDVQAIGCDTRRVYSTQIGADDDIPKEFRLAFQRAQELTLDAQDIFENEFVVKFLDTKLGNKDKKFVLFPSVEKLKGFYSMKLLTELEDTDFWTESKRYQVQPR